MLLSKKEKETLVQSTLLVILNGCILTFFNFNRINADDWKRILNATITVTIPMIMNVYKSEKRSNIVKENFSTLGKRIRFSLLSTCGIAIGILFEYLIEIFATQSLYMFYLFWHFIKLYIAYMLFIMTFSLILEPWLYLFLFKISDRLN